MSVATETPRPSGSPDSQRLPLIVAGLLVVVLAVAAGQAGGMKLFGAAVIGAFAGLALYHAAFGFTAAWRRLVRERRGAGLRAQMLLIALTIMVSYPLLAIGRDIGLPTGGFVFPFGVAAAIGAFVFGIGMQLGGGCGSGTLFTAGGGSTRMMVTLAAFIAGSLIATVHLHWWNTLPRFSAYSVVRNFGLPMALIGTLTMLALITAITVLIERRAHGTLQETKPTGSLLKGPWSLYLGAVALALVCIATFLVLQRPWGITSAFALWGGKIAWTLGVPIDSWPYWENQMARVERTVLTDATSVMNFGIMAGALGAAALAGRYRPVLSLSTRDIATAIIGGLMMGYGARLAYGCNIGGYLGGIVSGSLHGWWWLVFGFAGSVVGTRLRAIVGMDPKTGP
ncbi:MAG: YeeE/YedE family protein [Pseudomonadota bacterium]